MSEAPERRPDQKPIKCVLVAADDRIRVRVFEDYENLEAIKNADFLVSYTCDVQPSAAAQKNIQDFVNGGGRYFALHGTNAVLKFLENGLVDAPDEMPVFSTRSAPASCRIRRSSRSPSTMPSRIIRWSRASPVLKPPTSNIW